MIVLTIWVVCGIIASLLWMYAGYHKMFPTAVILAFGPIGLFVVLIFLKEEMF